MQGILQDLMNLYLNQKHDTFLFFFLTFIFLVPVLWNAVTLFTVYLTQFRAQVMFVELLQKGCFPLECVYS